MYIASFGHDAHKDLTFTLSDIYIDVREELPLCDRKCFGVIRRVQKHYMKQKGVKAFYKTHIWKKIKKVLSKRKHTRWRVFIGDHAGATEAVVFAERLEQDLIKQCKVYASVEHLTINLL